jgi:hypothetical protein
MGWKATRVIVGTDATALTTGDEGHQTASSVAITNLSGTETIWIGGPDVTVAEGYRLLPGAEVAADPENRRDLPYAIAAVPGVEVAVLRTGVGL